MEMDRDYGLYDGRTFKQDRFAEWLIRENIAWPLTDTGQLSLEDDTFNDLARTYPKLKPVRQLRQALSGMRLHDLAISKDGFNRCFLNPFGSRTGRNQPSNSEFIFGPAKWLRGLIKPPEGYGISYLDWGGQEFGTAAALSQDKNMREAYLIKRGRLPVVCEEGRLTSTGCHEKIATRTAGPVQDCYSGDQLRHRPGIPGTADQRFNPFRTAYSRFAP